MGKFHIGRCTPFMEELPTFGRMAEINDSDGYILYPFVPVHGFVDKRIDKRCHEEDEHHAGVGEDTMEFTRKDKRRIRDALPILI